MFERLGKLVERHWPAILVLWLIAFLAGLGVHLRWYGKGVPNFREVATDGEFTFLPPDMQSLVGERLQASAFPDDLLRSIVVVVVWRHNKDLLEEDYAFIENVLKPGLEKVREDHHLDPKLKIITPKSPRGGKLLKSEDQQAAMVLMQLKSEFLEWGNQKVIDSIEKLLYTNLKSDTTAGTSRIPRGLFLSMSGSATVGRDMLVAGQESAKSTERWTTILVVILLLAIYRAPLLAIIPLASVIVSVQIALALIILLTRVPGLNFRVFFGLEVYITVVTYGTGVDYCLFLIARYKEELDKGLPLPKALTATLSQVGAAVLASAATVICGIGMMVFAEFGKFREAGVGIAVSLIVGLFAALTLTPALLRLAGRIAFWPFGRTERIPSEGGSSLGTSLINRLVPRNRYQVLWEKIGALLIRRPGTVLVTAFLVMLPFAMLGLYRYNYLSYGLLTELPPTKKSVEGAKAVQEHYPAGYTGPVSIFINSEDVDPETGAGLFHSNEGKAAVESLMGILEKQMAKLGIADIYYFETPLGLKNRPALDAPLKERTAYSATKRLAEEAYISQAPERPGTVTKIDIVSDADPFARESIQRLTTLETAIEEARANEPALASLRKAHIHYVGPTASIRDLKFVTDADQIKIDLLVLGAVFLILVLLLRRPAISAYLIVSVFFSYFVTLGVTYAFYWLKDPDAFAGLDWKVPMFLFTILMAIGEDYNIFLMTRIEEEQKRHGPIEGIRIAMLRTGTIISSCGIIMAGTFLSLQWGSLVGLQQLGFALAFGVLLDTFVVRPILVPAYLIMLDQGRFGIFSRILGASDVPTADKKKIDRPPTRPKAHVDV